MILDAEAARTGLRARRETRHVRTMNTVSTLGTAPVRTLPPSWTLAIYDRAMNDQAYVRCEIVCPGIGICCWSVGLRRRWGAWPQSGCGCLTAVPEVDYSLETSILSIVRISAITAEHKRRSFRGRVGRVTRE